MLMSRLLTYAKHWYTYSTRTSSSSHSSSSLMYICKIFGSTVRCHRRRRRSLYERLGSVFSTFCSASHKSVEAFAIEYYAYMMYIIYKYMV